MALYLPFYSLVIELALQYDIPVRQPIPESLYGHVRLKGRRSTVAAVIQSTAALGIRHPFLAMRLLSYFVPLKYRRQSALLKAAGVTTTDWLIDSYYGNATVDNFTLVIQQLPPGVSEVPVHPAVVDSQLRSAGAMYVEERTEELSVLLDPRVREELAQYGVQAVDFSFLRSAISVL